MPDCEIGYQDGENYFGESCRTALVMCIGDQISGNWKCPQTWSERDGGCRARSKKPLVSVCRWKIKSPMVPRRRRFLRSKTRSVRGSYTQKSVHQLPNH